MTLTFTIPIFLAAIISTVRALICRLLFQHNLSEWPYVTVAALGQRMRPYRKCSRCHTIAAVEQGRRLLENSSARNDVVVVEMRARPFIGGNV